MSVVSARLKMKHLCTIERVANGAAVNGRGNPVAPDWEPHLTNVPCSAWTSTGRERTDEDAIVDFANLRMIVPLGTDVTERDRIADVTSRGAAVINGPVLVHAVFQQRDYLELILVRITG